MSKTSKTKRTADEIAEMASRGEDVSAYFTNKFTVVRPVHRVNVDLTQGMLRELDARAARLNISRDQDAAGRCFRKKEEGFLSKRAIELMLTRNRRGHSEGPSPCD